MDSPRPTDTGNPRFTEHLPLMERFRSSSPPYPHHSPQPSGFHPESPPLSQYGGDNASIDHYAAWKNKDRPMSPELIEGGLEVAHFNDDAGKEVAYPSPSALPYQRSLAPEEPSSQKRKRILGIPLTLLYVIAAAIVILAIALGVGLGVGLSRNHGTSSNPVVDVNVQYLIGGAIDQSYFSRSGAFNGSGIALASQSFATSLASATQGSVVVYFQHWTGQIRYLQLSPGGQWLGGSFSEVVATDAKNSTPLSAVSYSLNGTNQWHVFYINNQNQLKQRSNSNTSNVWVDGPINQANLTVFDADQVGMQACYYGNDYGDVDYHHSPVPGQSNGSAHNELGMHMWFASDANTFQQYGYRYGDAQWEFQQAWPNKNGHAGVGCYSWGGGTTTYVMFVNQQNTAEIYWKDTNSSTPNSTAHPINIWTNTSISVPNVWPSTSLGYTNYFYAQDGATKSFMGHNIQWAAENTTMNDTFTVQGQPGIPGTHLSVTTLPASSGGNNVFVFYQANGSDITVSTRDLFAGAWTQSTLPIPAM